jgi:hypothetical protein
VTTHSKQEVSTAAQKGVEHNNSREFFQEDHEGSSWEKREARLSLNKDLANLVYQYLDFSLSLNMTSKLSRVMIFLDRSDSCQFFSERDYPLKIDLLKQLEKLFSA